MVNKSILLPEKARQRVQQTIDSIDEMQRSIGAYLDGIATALDVPQGYTFDQNAMSFVPPVAPPVPGEEAISNGAVHDIDMIPEIAP